MSIRELFYSTKIDARTTFWRHSLIRLTDFNLSWARFIGAIYKISWRIFRALKLLGLDIVKGLVLLFLSIQLSILVINESCCIIIMNSFILIYQLLLLLVLLLLLLMLQNSSWELSGVRRNVTIRINPLLKYLNSILVLICGSLVFGYDILLFRPQ